MHTDMSHTADLSPANDPASAILASAITQFSRRGFHGASMRQLAGDAGMTPANVYNYFAAKSDILLAILRRAAGEQIEATSAAIRSAGPSTVDRFVAAVQAFVGFDLANLEVCFIANSELRYLDAGQREEIVAVRDRQQRLFEGLVWEGVDSGVFRTPHPDQAAIAILTMCAGVTVWYRPDGSLSADEVARRYARYALAMVEGV